MNEIFMNKHLKKMFVEFSIHYPIGRRSSKGPFTKKINLFRLNMIIFGKSIFMEKINHTKILFLQNFFPSEKKTNCINKFIDANHPSEILLFKTRLIFIEKTVENFLFSNLFSKLPVHYGTYISKNCFSINSKIKTLIFIDKKTDFVKSIRELLVQKRRNLLLIKSQSKISSFFHASFFKALKYGKFLNPKGLDQFSTFSEEKKLNFGLLAHRKKLIVSSDANKGFSLIFSNSFEKLICKEMGNSFIISCRKIIFLNLDITNNRNLTQLFLIIMLNFKERYQNRCVLILVLLDHLNTNFFSFSSKKQSIFRLNNYYRHFQILFGLKFHLGKPIFMKYFKNHQIRIILSRSNGIEKTEKIKFLTHINIFSPLKYVDSKVITFFAKEYKDFTFLRKWLTHANQSCPLRIKTLSYDGKYQFLDFQEKPKNSVDNIAFLITEENYKKNRRLFRNSDTLVFFSVPDSKELYSEIIFLSHFNQKNKKEIIIFLDLKEFLKKKELIQFIPGVILEYI